MQSMQKYSKISTWHQHIQIDNLLPLEKDGKSEQAGCLGSLFSEKNKEDHICIVTSLLSIWVMKNGSFMTIFNAKAMDWQR